jgi:hypothetical protein
MGRRAVAAPDDRLGGCGALSNKRAVQAANSRGRSASSAAFWAFVLDVFGTVVEGSVTWLAASIEIVGRFNVPGILRNQGAKGDRVEFDYG